MDDTERVLHALRALHGGKRLNRRGSPPRKHDVAAAISLAGSRSGEGSTVFTLDEMISSFDALIATSEVERLELEHVVCVFDVLAGLPTVFGPFEGPVAASTFASQFLTDVGCDYEWALRVRIVPLDRIAVEQAVRRRSLKEQFRSARHLREVRRSARRTKRGM